MPDTSIIPMITYPERIADPRDVFAIWSITAINLVVAAVMFGVRFL